MRCTVLVGWFGGGLLVVASRGRRRLQTCAAPSAFAGLVGDRGRRHLEHLPDVRRRPAVHVELDADARRALDAARPVARGLAGICGADHCFDGRRARRGFAPRSAGERAGDRSPLPPPPTKAAIGRRYADGGTAVR